MQPSKIAWTEYVWNPVTGCTPFRPGCANCYAKRMAETRLRGRCGYPQRNPFAPRWRLDRLDEVTPTQKPRMIFVSSMGDLFHPGLYDVDHLDLLTSTPSEHGVANLTAMPRLKVLAAPDGLSDQGLKHLTRLTALTHLDLSGTQVTDRGLRHLYRLHALTHLDLNNTLVSDVGAAHLAGMANLRHLNLQGTRVTLSGVGKLVQARPYCEVLY